ncbi:MAG: phospholipid carrier-dependent glycosyltransferase, partial [Bacteroidetes bacterium]
FFFYSLLNFFVEKSFALFGTLFFALNPLLTIYSTEVLSDIPFVAVLLVSIYYFIRFQQNASKQNVHFIILVVTTICAIMLREIGFALLFTYVLFFVLQKKWNQAIVISLSVLLILGIWNIRNHLLVEKTPFSQTGNMPWIFENVITSTETSLLVEIPVRLWHNFKSYAEYLFGMAFYPTFVTSQLQSLIGNSSSVYVVLQQILSWGKYFVIVLVSFTSLRGIVSLLRAAQPLASNFPSAPQIPGSSASNVLIYFSIFYLLILFLFPFNDVRYVLPITPFYILFCLIGLKNLSGMKILEKFLTKQKTLGFAVLLLVLTPNIIALSEIIRSNIRINQSPPMPWKTIGAWIQQNTPADCIIASPVKDLAIVVGNERKVLEMHPSIETPKFEMMLRDFQVEYLLSPAWYDDATVFDAQDNSSRKFWFEHAYSAGSLHLFKVHSLLQHPSLRKILPNYSEGVSSHLLQAQILFGEEQYDSASYLIAQALALAPKRPDVIYNNLVCSALQEKQEHAQEYYRILTALPSEIGMYIFPAQKLMQALNALTMAKQLTSPEQRSIQMAEAATEYWKMGYRRKACSIMEELLISDSLYFNGLLWGMHYAIQLNDLSTAKNYAARLQSLDRYNPLVQTYLSIINISDSISATNTNVNLTNFHMRLARLYLSIELPEEALDEAERALGYSPENPETLQFIAAILEKKNLPQIAAKIYKKINP